MHRFACTNVTPKRNGAYFITHAPLLRMSNNLLLTERGPYWGILAQGRGSTDRAQRGPYKNDRGPIFPGTARASYNERQKC